MKLEKLILVNWGSLRPGDYPMGNMTLLTGPTGSGKSTLLDALQTGMTAVYQHIFNYNPGQDETTQSARNGKTKRTLWSYIVGAEDNLFARPDGAHGYVGLVFRPSEGETGNSFTALVAAEACVTTSGGRKQAVQECLNLLIVDDAELQFSDLAVRDEQGRLTVVDVSKAEKHLQEKYPKVYNHRDNKREYLCQLYGRFRGQRTVSFAEAEAAAKSWTQAIAHKPIGSVDELVKTQILEFDSQQLSQRITQISELIRQIHTLRKEGERLTESISKLDTLLGVVAKSSDCYERVVVLQVLAAKRALRDEQAKLAAAQTLVGELATKIADEEAKRASAMENRNSAYANLVSIEATLRGIPAAGQKDALEGKRKTARESLDSLLTELIQALTAVENLHATALKLISFPIPRECHDVLGAVGQIAQELESLGTQDTAGWKKALTAVLKSTTSVEAPEFLQALHGLRAIGSRFDALYWAMAGATDSFISAVHTQIGALKTLEDGAAAREKLASERKKNLAEGGADYPREVKIALTRFHEDKPHIAVRVLCDLVEPVDPKWMPAIEGYLANARFNFVVSEAHEEEATRFVKDRFLRARVIQGALCLKKARPDMIPSNSIVHELTTEHPIVKAYLADQFGPVVKVQDFEALRYTSRGVMMDGRAAGGADLLQRTG